MTALKIPKQVEIGGRIITIKVDHNLDDFGSAVVHNYTS